MINPYSLVLTIVKEYMACKAASRVIFSIALVLLYKSAIVLLAKNRITDRGKRQIMQHLMKFLLTLLIYYDKQSKN